MPAICPARLPAHRRAPMWLLGAVTLLFVTLEPALFLVVLAVGLSALALLWIVMLVKMLLVNAFATDHAPEE